MAEGKLPVTIITGFLGSGKTTVLSHWLEHPMFQRVSVIVNEFGQAGLDQRVLRQIEEKTVLLSGGCACCNIRDDLVKELAAMIDSRDRGELDVDRVVIETTGLADPAPILFSIMTDSVLRHHYQVDCVVTCLDAVNGSFQLEHTSESVKQIATADKVLLTKTDLAKEEEVPALIERVEEINPSAVILKTDMGEIDPELVLSEEGLPRRERPEIAEAMKNRNAEAAAEVCIDLESKILFCLNEQIDGFGMLEIPSIVAALDRYKYIVLDVAAQRGESRHYIQSAADELNEATGITYTHKIRRAQSDD